MAIIGIDLDDVLADFIHPFMDAARKRFGRPAEGAEPIDWEWSNILPSKEEQKLVWDDLLSIENFWTTLPVEEGASKCFLQELDAKHELYYPTARVQSKGVHVGKQSASWVQANFGVFLPTVFVAYEKGPLATALKYDYFIDDRPKNCLAIKEVLPKCKVFLKDSGHNLAFDNAAIGLPRVKTFDDFATIILEETK